jgi:hypothetical protein
MKAPASHPIHQATLAGAIPHLRASGPQAWTGDLPGGAGEVDVRARDGWVCLRALPCPGVARALVPSLDLLRAQAGVGGSVKFALADGRVGRVEVRAEASGLDEGLPGPVLRDLLGEIVAAKRLAEGCWPEPPFPAAASPRSDAAALARLEGACREAGWAVCARPDGTLHVALADAADGATARLALRGGGGFVASADLVDFGLFESATTQRALVRLLFRLNATVRGMRATVAAPHGAEAILLEAAGYDSSSCAAIAAALGSLSVGLRLAAAEADALGEMEISRLYLGMVAGDPAENENTETKEGASTIP